MKEEDLDKSKWIEISYGISSSASILIQSKKEMKEYADELEWEMTYDKKGHIDENGTRMYSINIIPKDKKISPEELREKKSLIDGFMVSILRNMYKKEEIEVRIFMYLNKSDDKKDILYVILGVNKEEKDYGGVLHISYDLKKAIKFEKENPKLAKSIMYGSSLKDWYDKEKKVVKNIFGSKENKERAKVIIETLEKCGINE